MSAFVYTNNLNIDLLFLGQRRSAPTKALGIYSNIFSLLIGEDLKEFRWKGGKKMEGQNTGALWKANEYYAGLCSTGSK